MLCTICHRHKAVIHYEGILDNRELKLHACERCAKKNNIETILTDPRVPLDELLPPPGQMPGPAGKADVPATCPQCGIAFKEFRKAPRRGCPACYKTFLSHLVPFLKGIEQHELAPGQREELMRFHLRREAIRLRYELHRAVKCEQYENAAALRDRLKEVEHFLQPQGSAAPEQPR